MRCLITGLLSKRRQFAGNKGEIACKERRTAGNQELFDNGDLSHIGINQQSRKYQ